MFDLFDDQIDVINDARAEFKRSKSVLLNSPTGSGKTEMAAYMIHAARQKNKRVIFTIPRKDLLEQTSLKFDSQNMTHSYIASGKPYNPHAGLYCGMVDTMARRLDKLPNADLLVVDETHFGSNALGSIINHYKERGAYILGLSGTPWKMSGQGLGCWYDSMVQGRTIKWLIENKRLSSYRYFRGKVIADASNVPKSGGNFQPKALGEFMESQRAVVGDCVNDYKMRCMGNIHIVRCASIKASQQTAQAFRDAGIPAMHVDGDTTTDERRRIFRAYALREIFVVCFVNLLEFGFDLEMASGGIKVTIESGSDLKPSESLSGQMQFWGRMLRYKLSPAIFCDNVNNYIRHQFPCTERDWTLEDRERKVASESERAQSVKQCPNCFYCEPPTTICYNCGHVYEIKSREIETVAGELEEMDIEAARIEERKKQGKARTLPELIKLGYERGYKPGKCEAWARMVYKSRGKK